ncbi:MAG: nitroreductase [Spirochaetae bacterium HGW-Spirochaetae-8]|jgi:nitroreductase|nr:MAG: nitroreductase [Spirochaetae bacterium HGW-Spirochaetae-8]
MHETIKTIMERHSCRNFQAGQVDEESLTQILDAGLQAATAMNHQSWYFTVVQDQKFLHAISSAVAGVMIKTEVPSLVERASDPGFNCFHHAPTVVFLSGDGSIYSIADCANAAQNMCVAATALGFGSCYLASFIQAFKSPEGKKLRGFFDLPAGYEPIFAVALGFAKETSSQIKPRERKISYIR